MNSFSKEVTLAAGWQNLIGVMQANNYTGTANLSEVNFSETAGGSVRIKAGHSSAVSAPASTSDGVPLSSSSLRLENIDAGLCWIYDAAGGTPLSIVSGSRY